MFSGALSIYNAVLRGCASSRFRLASVKLTPLFVVEASERRAVVVVGATVPIRVLRRIAVLPQMPLVSDTKS